ncbi:unnamed protein product [Boreogadus saida]
MLRRHRGCQQPREHRGEHSKWKKCSSTTTHHPPPPTTTTTTTTTTPTSGDDKPRRNRILFQTLKSAAAV